MPDPFPSKRSELLQRQLERERERFNFATIGGEIGVWDWDFKNNHLNWNAIMHQLFDLPVKSFQHSYKDFIECLHPEDRASVEAAIDATISEAKQNNAPFELNYRVIWRDRSVHYIRAKGQLFKDAEGEFTRVTGICYDVSKEVQLQNELKQLALYDPLTHIPNRIFFLTMLEERIQHDKPFSLIFMDINGFKKVNDSLGHEAGDQLLNEIASRLRAFMQITQGVIGRLGGDEFLVCLDDIIDHEKIARTCDSLAKQITLPYFLKDHETHIGASMGIACFPEHGKTANELLCQADLAMYYHKRTQKKPFEFYHKNLTALNNRRNLIETYLFHAIEKDELSLVSQPIFDLKTNKIFSREILLRWTHPILGEVPPDEFIPIAIRMGVMHDLGAWVLQQTLDSLEKEEIILSINFSAFELETTDLLETIHLKLLKRNIHPSHLIIELTEITKVENEQALHDRLTQIIKTGIQVALDDFGKGFSSVMYLKNIPLHHIKLDQALITHCPTDPTSQAIIQALIQLSNALNLTIIAEGIETEAQWAFLKSAGCHYGQGHFLGAPEVFK